MSRSIPGLPVHHQFPESTQTHVHWVGDTIQPSHPLSSPSPPALYVSQHQSLFKWVSSLHQVARALEFQLQHQSFQWIIPLHRAIVIYSSHRLCLGMNTYVSFKTSHYICVTKAWLHFWSVWASSLIWFQGQVENTNLTCRHPLPSPTPELQSSTIQSPFLAL